MRIGILNLPLDNNYGGNLQRYALVKVLQDMGHSPIHLYLRNDSIVDFPLWWKMISFTKRVLKKIILGFNGPLIYRHPYYVRMKEIFRFYRSYIPHTRRIFVSNDFKRYASFDAYIVGSDQVWRNQYANKFLSEMYLGFVDNSKTKRIAYGVSFGTDIDEYSNEERCFCGKLYSKFYAVSVREQSALDLIALYGWEHPAAIRVVDPTFLLNAADYEKLINNTVTVQPEGDVFCYVLDENQEMELYISNFCREKGLVPFFCALQNKINSSIEQWLRNIRDAKYVITDSYHGVIFSLIFNKPFTVYENMNRGSARIKELKRLFNIQEENFQLDNLYISEIIDKEKTKAINFLVNSLR